jgi:DNA-binding XRE family transcriptional regulator
MDLGMTQKEAARLLGVDQWTVINWEKGRTEPVKRLVPSITLFLGYMVPNARNSVDPKDPLNR